MICVSAEHMIWYTSTSANINSLLSYNKDIPTINATTYSKYISV